MISKLGWKSFANTKAWMVVLFAMILAGCGTTAKQESHSNYPRTPDRQERGKAKPVYLRTIDTLTLAVVQ